MVLKKSLKGRLHWQCFTVITTNSLKTFFLSSEKSLKAHLHLQCFVAIMPATMTRDSHFLLALATLGGQRDRDRIISIYVALPKVAKASK